MLVDYDTEDSLRSSKPNKITMSFFVNSKSVKYQTAMIAFSLFGFVCFSGLCGKCLFLKISRTSVKPFTVQLSDLQCGHLQCHHLDYVVSSIMVFQGKKVYHIPFSSIPSL